MKVLFLLKSKDFNAKTDFISNTEKTTERVTGSLLHRIYQCVLKYFFPSSYKSYNKFEISNVISTEVKEMTRSPIVEKDKVRLLSNLDGLKKRFIKNCSDDRKKVIEDQFNVAIEKIRCLSNEKPKVKTHRDRKRVMPAASGKNDAVVPNKVVVSPAPVRKEGVRGDNIVNDLLIKLFMIPSRKEEIIKELRNHLTKVQTNLLKQRWELIKKTLNGKNGEFEVQTNRLIELLKIYPELDPEKAFVSLIEKNQESFFLKLNSQIKKGEFSQELLQSTSDHKQLIEEFDSYYRDELQLSHLWLFDYGHRISQPFNQSTHIHENLGDGVCFSNSLERLSLIIKQPKINSNKIPMGISKSVQFAQAKTNLSFHMGKNIDLENAKHWGLRLVETCDFKQSEGSFGKKISEFSKKGHPLFILGLHKQNEAGHAINIQFDHAKNVYRFIDDNLGICTFKTEDEFIKGFSEYMDEFYPDYPKELAVAYTFACS